MFSVSGIVPTMNNDTYTTTTTKSNLLLVLIEELLCIDTMLRLS